MHRRDFCRFVLGTGLTILGGCSVPSTSGVPPGKLTGPSFGLGHLLRDGALPEPTEIFGVETLIVGGGVGGLSAAWKLAKSGVKDFLLVELEDEIGGNSRSASNEVSEYPLSAHYLPLPPRSARATRELLAELGVLEGDPDAERPRYDERYLCFPAQERLYRNGWWQDGLIPELGVGQAEQAQYQRFFELMHAFRDRKDGERPAFALPMALSSRSADLLALDKLSMQDWLISQSLDSLHLHWYIDYACRDDYGTSIAQTSAWAGIHYFACRTGQAQDAAHDTVLTTPGGNAWLAKGMAQSVASHAGNRVLYNAPVFRVQQTTTKKSPEFWVDLWLARENRAIRIRTRQLIWAAPFFLIPYVFTQHAELSQAARQFSHAPWLIANLTLSRLPEERGGSPMAWDNVIYGSQGLGYVVATHQRMQVKSGPTVLTYYRALAEVTPQIGRALLQDNKREIWIEEIFRELERPHPDIRAITTQIDIYRNAHAMVRPVPGFIWGGARSPFTSEGRYPGLHFAHADASGISLFEEAQYRGVRAAENALAQFGKKVTSSLL